MQYVLCCSNDMYRNFKWAQNILHLLVDVGVGIGMRNNALNHFLSKEKPKEIYRPSHDIPKERPLKVNTRFASWNKLRVGKQRGISYIYIITKCHFRTCCWPGGSNTSWRSLSPSLVSTFSFPCSTSCRWMGNSAHWSRRGASNRLLYNCGHWRRHNPRHRGHQLPSRCCWICGRGGN